MVLASACVVGVGLVGENRSEGAGGGRGSQKEEWGEEKGGWKDEKGWRGACLSMEFYFTHSFPSFSSSSKDQSLLSCFH